MFTNNLKIYKKNSKNFKKIFQKKRRRRFYMTKHHLMAKSQFSGFPRVRGRKFKNFSGPRSYMVKCVYR